MTIKNIVRVFITGL